MTISVGGRASLSAQRESTASCGLRFRDEGQLMSTRASAGARTVYVHKPRDSEVGFGVNVCKQGQPESSIAVREGTAARREMSRIRRLH